MSHLAPATKVHPPVCLDRPFSNFEHIEEHYDGSHPIHKLFSISRCHGGRTLLVEEIPAVGNVAEENEDIENLDRGFKHLSLLRLTFWKPLFQKKLPATARSKDCIGYVILKKDRLTRHVVGKGVVTCDEWHVYEAVFHSYPHRHTYAKAKAGFEFMADGRRFHITGCLYAQQNEVNKTCAQVSIRSIASSYLGNNELSYRRINALAAKGCRKFLPGEGFGHRHTEKVLNGLGIEHHMVDYAGLSRKRRKNKEGQFPEWERYPCEKLLYAGVEAGCGALMSFKPTDPDARPDALHMIPVFGHTFNEDSWVPNAEKTYFRIGKKISYIPSLAWLSHFLVHDDNFGANLCIPRNFINRKDVRFIYELRPKGWCYSGVDAETTAAFIFCSIIEGRGTRDNPWIRRLRKYYGNKGRVILRHVPITTADYLKKLKSCRDWDGAHEPVELIDALKEHLPRGRKLWMVEISVPEVFPTNKRKLGEILLDASHPLELEKDSNFIFGRLPGNFILLRSLADDGNLNFTFVRSEMNSHTPLF
jgi:hypothetical protein